LGYCPSPSSLIGLRVMARNEQVISLTDAAGSRQRYRQAGMALSKGELI
jgi:hypothetical protein